MLFSCGRATIDKTLTAIEARTVLQFLRARAFGWYVLSIFILIAGIKLSLDYYPSNFNWLYTVASSLGSARDNPSGRVWYTSGLGLAMLLQWPYVSALRKRIGPSATGLTRVALASLGTGIGAGILLGLQGVFVPDLSEWITKGHEIIALVVFSSLHLGIFLLLAQAMWRRKVFGVSAVIVVLPFLAIALSQLFLWLAQRNIGWVGQHWEKTGIPLWLSFAFWQWLSIGFVIIGLGLLVLLPPARDAA